MAQQISTNTFGCAKWVVSSDATQGTHTTIQAAINAASSGDTIFIRNGTYTENLTISAGINLTAYNCDQYNNVIIKGKCTATFAGTVAFSGIQFLTNADNAIVVSGSNATVLRFTNCYINSNDAMAVSFSSSSSSSLLYFNNCRFDIQTTGIASYTMSSAGELRLNFCELRNTGSSTTTNNNSAGVVVITGGFHAQMFSTSSTGTMVINNANISPGNNTVLTTTGSPLATQTDSSS